ncbi:DMT family transporter [Cohaesibacter celericrescens]|uniref:EamA family transporter n=1 Tax=Cohaesibacter celericrescens TaxID=2067669 RepID=A0A2N5XPJ8_9HYPH|nr:DMT family transporter [Cohaesibacter celericrescens]PLW76350.1 EamA family transporter [Cohaesibacter celericrescens]
MIKSPTRQFLPLIAFCSLGIIWGSNFIFMKWAADYLTPTQIVFWRVLFGFVPIALYAVATGALKWVHIRLAKHFFVMSLLATSVYFFGFAKGTSLLLSGVAGALSGAIPLFAFIAAIAFLPEENRSVRKSFGVMIGFAGVLIIANPFGSDLAATNLEGVAYMALGALSVGSSFVYARKYLSAHKIAPVALATYQLGFGLVTLALLTDFTVPDAFWSDQRAAVGLVIGLGLLGTGCAYIIYYFIVGTLGAVAASAVTYIPPVVALLIGVFLVGEPIQLSSYFATALIFVGVFLLKGSKPQPDRGPKPSSSDGAS